MHNIPNFIITSGRLTIGTAMQLQEIGICVTHRPETGDIHLTRESIQPEAAHETKQLPPAA